METRIFSGIIIGIIITIMGFLLNNIRIKHRELDEKIGCKVDRNVHKIQVQQFNDIFKANEKRLDKLEEEIKKILEATARIEQQLKDKLSET